MIVPYQGDRECLNELKCPFLYGFLWQGCWKQKSNMLISWVLEYCNVLKML